MRRSAAAAYQIHKLCIAIIEVHSMQHHDSGIKETIETDDASFNSSENLQYSDWHAESEYLLLIVVKFLAVVGVRIHLQNSINIIATTLRHIQRWLILAIPSSTIQFNKASAFLETTMTKSVINNRVSTLV